jgi:hypothetical protein
MILVAFLGIPAMFDSGSLLMAKKKKSPGKTGEDERVAVVVLKDTPEYREWLNAISRDSLIPVASIVRDALAKWAAQRGYPAPPERHS